MRPWGCETTSMMMPSPAGDPVPPVAPPPPIGQPLAALGLRAELLDCRIGAIAFSGNGKWLAAADGGRVHFFDAQGNHARELRLEPDRLAGSQWLPFQVRGICRALHARGTGMFSSPPATGPCGSSTCTDRS